jgi:hypothetical protein
MRYVIIKGYSIENLTIQVNEFIERRGMAESWVPHGQPFLATNEGGSAAYWRQVMWRAK